MKSEGTLTEREFSSSKIKRARILFRPGSTLISMLEALTYQKATTAAIEEEETSTETTSTETSETGEGA